MGAACGPLHRTLMAKRLSLWWPMPEAWPTPMTIADLTPRCLLVSTCCCCARGSLACRPAADAVPTAAGQGARRLVAGARTGGDRAGDLLAIERTGDVPRRRAVGRGPPRAHRAGPARRRRTGCGALGAGSAPRRAVHRRGGCCRAGAAGARCCAACHQSCALLAGSLVHVGKVCVFGHGGWQWRRSLRRLLTRAAHRVDKPWSQCIMTSTTPGTIGKVRMLCANLPVLPAIRT
jgi:hypothetical protein